MLNQPYSPKFLAILGLISMAIFWFASFHTFLLWITGLIMMMALFKKKEIVAPEKKDVYLAPMSGQVKSIRQRVWHPVFGADLTEIRLVLPFFMEMGLYLPCPSEVTELKNTHGRPMLRFSEEEFASYRAKLGRMEWEEMGLSGVLLKLKVIKGSQIGLKILRCGLGFFPRVWVLAGDRGEAGANFGDLPLGGTLLMYLPAESEILVKANDYVVAGQTLIGEFQPC